jgi:hypothetical protein
MQEVQSNYSILCKYCQILLVGKAQFMVYMVYNHNMNYKKLTELWVNLESRR